MLRGAYNRPFGGDIPNQVMTDVTCPILNRLGRATKMLCVSGRGVTDMGMPTTMRVVLAVLASAIFVARPAYAVTIYSNFGSGSPGYSTAGGALIITPLAWAFTATETANVTQIDLAFFAFSTTNSFTVSLNDNNGGNLGAVLGSWTFQNVTTDRTNDLHTITGITGVTLDLGTSYFLSIAFDSGTGSGGEWNANTIGALAPWIQGTLHANNGSQGAFDVLAAPTPLPTALPLFATGLGGLGLLGWRRKRKNAAAIAA